MKSLLKNGAHVNAVTIKNQTPLQFAILTSLYLYLNYSYLIRKKITIKNGFHSHADKEPNVAEVLLRHGADPNILDDFGITTLTVAVCYGNFIYFHATKHWNFIFLR